MDIYFKTVGLAITGVLLCLILTKNAKDYSVLITIVLCCVVAGAALSFLKPVIQLVDRLDSILRNNAAYFSVLIKAVGIAFIGETVSAICADAGHASIGKTIGILTTVAILWAALPLINSLFELIQSILEMI